MRESEALDYLERLVPAMQKDRSNILEACGENEAVAKALNPWVFGDKALLPQVVKVVERGTIDPSGFNNILWVIENHIPGVAIVQTAWGQPIIERDPTLFAWDDTDTTTTTRTSA